MLEPCGANGIAILSGNHESSELDEVSGPKVVCAKQGLDVGKDLIGLLLD